MVFDAGTMTCHDVPVSILKKLPYVEIEESNQTEPVDMRGVI